MSEVIFDHQSIIDYAKEYTKSKIISTIKELLNDWFAFFDIDAFMSENFKCEPNYKYGSFDLSIRCEFLGLNKIYYATNKCIRDYIFIGIGKMGGIGVSFDSITSQAQIAEKIDQEFRIMTEETLLKYLKSKIGWSDTFNRIKPNF